MKGSVTFWERQRLDRQLRIAGWNQRALEEARVGVVGDSDRLASLFLLSAAALGINDVVVIAPWLDERLLDIARRVNPAFNLTFIEGFYTHPVLDDLFDGCQVLVDLSRYGLANKLLLEKGFWDSVPVVRGFCHCQDGWEGFRVFTYLRGREWQELEQLVAVPNLPHPHSDDGVLDIVVAGLVLEEVKNVLMRRNVSEEMITYRREVLAPSDGQPNLCVVGAGALGNFVGLALAYAGFRHITFMDPDEIETTNLNRQVFFWDAEGLPKAEVLAERLNERFGTCARACVASFTEETDVSAYDAVFDCVDNHETRIVLSETCKAQHKVLISGGTSVEAGQMVVYDPVRHQETPAELLGLYELVAQRERERRSPATTACIEQPEPAVIMTNQIVAGFMVDACRRLRTGQEPQNVFYDATRGKRI